MEVLIGIIISLMVTTAIIPSTKSTVDPIIVGLAVGGASSPILAAAGITNSITVASTKIAVADIIATGIGTAAALRVETD